MNTEQTTNELKAIIDGINVALSNKPQHVKAFNHLLYVMSETYSLNAEFTIDNSIPIDESRRLECVETLMHSIYNSGRRVIPIQDEPIESQGFNEAMHEREWMDKLSLDEWAIEMDKRMNPTRE